MSENDKITSYNVPIIKNDNKTEIIEKTENIENIENDEFLTKNTNFVKGLKEVASAGKIMKDAFSSPLERVIVEKTSEKFLDLIIGNNNTQQTQEQEKKSFLDSGFMIALGSKIPDVLPTIFDIALSRLGPEKTENLLNKIENRMLSTSNNFTSEIVSLENDSEETSKIHENDYISFEDQGNIENTMYQTDSIQSKPVNTLHQTDTLHQTGYQQTESMDMLKTRNSELENSILKQNEMLMQVISVIEEDRKKINELSNIIMSFEERINKEKEKENEKEEKKDKKEYTDTEKEYTDTFEYEKDIEKDMEDIKKEEKIKLELEKDETKRKSELDELSNEPSIATVNILSDSSNIIEKTQVTPVIKIKKHKNDDK